jgi:hypothetical protein
MDMELKYEFEQIEAVKNNETTLKWAVVPMGADDRARLLEAYDMEGTQWLICIIEDSGWHYLVAWGCADDGSTDIDTGHLSLEVQPGVLTEEQLYQKFDQWVLSAHRDRLID